MFKFNFGNKRPTIVRYALVGIVLTTLVSSVSYCTHISENTIWDLIDETQRRYFPQKIINDYIVTDPIKLQRRIHRDVDIAIKNAIPEYERIIQNSDKKYQPKYVKEMNDESMCYSDECKALAPPMRICSAWVDSCRNE